MNPRNRRLAVWLILGLVTLILFVACSPTGTQEAADQADAVGAETAETGATEPADDTPEAASAEEEVSEEPAEVESPDEAVSEESNDDADVSSESDAATEDEPADPPAEEETSPDDSSGEGSDEAEEEETAEETAVSEPEDGIFTDDSRTERQQIISADWNTNWNRHTVPYDELLALLPVRDGIPAIDDPKYISPEEAAEWLVDNEPVIVYENNGDARAYPLQIMTYHEIVNDEVGGDPVTVTFCPLCNSAIVFDRRLGSEVYDFGTSGWLRNSDLVMYDRQTEGLWQQFTGEGIVGDLAGEQLTFLPSSIISFADFREAFPDGLVLSRDTGHDRPYGQNPYPGYDRIGENPFAFAGVPDGRLAAMERVIAVSLGDVDVAYPLTLVAEEGIINDTQGGQDLVIFHIGGTSSALDAPVISMGADVGATGVFDPNLNGEKLTFAKEGENIVDEQTGSRWNILGQAIEGPLAGEQLTPIIHGDHFWFAWAAFEPETIIFGS